MKLIFILGVSFFSCKFSEDLLARATAAKIDNQLRGFLTTDLIELKASKFFVDKTDFIYDFLVNQQPKYLYLTAPPLMGKTYLLKTTGLFCNATFLTINDTVSILEDTLKSSKFFNNTIISKDEKFYKTHWNNYSVIFIDFAPLRETHNFDSFRTSMCSLLEDMVNDYWFLRSCIGLHESAREFFKNYSPGNPYCLHNFKQAIQDGGKFVKILKEELGREVIVLGDNYDSILHAHLLNDIPGSAAIFVDFVEGLLHYKGNCGENFNPAKVLFVGTLNLGGIMSNLIKDITHRDLHHDEQTAKYFGLTKPEVKQLLSKFSLEDHYRTVQDWYNGFGVLGSQLKVFNISSVVSYIRRLRLEPKAIPSSPSFRALTGMKALFAHYRIGSTLTETLFGDGTRVRSPNDLNMTLLLGLREKIMLVELKETSENMTETNFKLITQEIDIFFRLLLDLGLISPVQDMGSTRLVKPTNRANLHTLRNYWYDSGYAVNYFNVSTKQEKLFTNAITNFEASNSSLQSLGDAIYNITSTKVPTKVSTFISLVYVCAKRSADRPTVLEKEDILVESGRAFHTSGEGDVEEKTDIVLVWKGKKRGAVLELKKAQKRNGSAIAIEAFEQMKKRRCTDIFATDSDYLKLHITDTVLLGLSVSADGSLNIVGEAYSSNGTSKMSFIREKGKKIKSTSDRKSENSVYDYDYN